MILTSSFDSTARLWDVVTKITSSFDSTARLWDVVTKKQIASFKHEAPLTNAVFSPDSKWILTASRDSTACLWEIEGDLPLPE